MGRTVQKGSLSGFSSSAELLLSHLFVDLVLVSERVMQRSGRMPNVRLCAASPQTLYNSVRLLRKLGAASPQTLLSESV